MVELQLVDNQQIQVSEPSNIVYDINNLLVTTFKDNDIQIFGTWDNPLFKANDIGTLLCIKNIRDTISEFDETQKLVSVEPTGAGPREMNMLTEDGLYEVLFMSRKPIAKSFRKHVCELLKQQRLELGKQIREQLIFKAAKDKQDIILASTDWNCPGNYFINNKVKKVCEYGYSNNILVRIKQQFKKLGQGFYVDKLIKCNRPNELERTLKKYQSEPYNGSREVIRDKNEEEMINIYNEAERNSILLNYDESNEIEHKKLDIEKGKIDIEKLKLEIELEKLRKESCKDKKEENIKELNVRIKMILLDKFQVGNKKDYVKLKDIRDILKNSGVKEKDIISIIKIVLDTFEESEFKENSRLNNKPIRNFFLNLKLK